jgi:3D (Asp-Asp-Asp) domain-containing protein
MQASTDWGTAIVVDPRWLARLRASNDSLRRTGTALRIGLAVVATGAVVAGGVAHHQARVADRQAQRIDHLARQVREARHTAREATIALDTLARSHRSILAATEDAPALGTRSWAHRFTVTKYVPRSRAYGKFNDGLTATLTKADPTARIVAVDPNLVPYGSSVWIEGLGWFRAEDCGSAIKGHHIDVLTATVGDAMEYGKQDRFVIVVPPADA